MRKTLRLARAFLFDPARAAAACAEPQTLGPALGIYGAALVCSALSLAFRPYDFPDPNAAVPSAPQGLFFWLKVMAWQPLLLAALIAFCGALLRWMKDGWLPLKVATSFFWTAAPFILTVLYYNDHLSKTAFAVLLVLWALPGVRAGRDVPAPEWRALASFLLGLNVIELASLLPESAATMLRWEAGYKGTAALAGLWMLVNGALGLRALPPERPLPRALLPLLFASVLQIVVVFAAFTLGWLPAQTLKALMYG